ncbi:tagaturonate reductase [Pedobacter sp. PWIIR3]
MILSKQTLSSVNTAVNELTSPAISDLPEKVLQFGTGVLLRGLPDYFIDKANKLGIFNGRIVVVKSTSKGDLADFEKQDGLFTICVRGLSDGKEVSENIINSSISRVLSTNNQWNEVLNLAKLASLQIIVSNTTEVGIVLLHESIHGGPPVSYPAKLLAVLYSRYQALKDESAAIVIIATELIPNNGKKLKSIVEELIAYNSLEAEFSEWLTNYAIFCDSLVDRIIPGKPDERTRSELSHDLGYQDELLIMAEPYRLWAIEGDERAASIVNLESADDGVVIKPDIEIYRELKVRLLNGTHTLACGIAFLSGIPTVSEAMNNMQIRNYIDQVMHSEIVPAIPYDVALEESYKFSKAVLDRFANPFIEHQWLSITFQYSMKLKIRILPVLIQYFKLFDAVPERIAFGFSAYLTFMKVSKKQGELYFGSYNGHDYAITDDQAEYFYRKSDVSEYPGNVLNDNVFWSYNLALHPEFLAQVEKNYHYINEHGIVAAMSNLK